MTEMELTDILIDDEIKKIIPELTEEEFKQLEQNILESGELDSPLIVWKDENILLDGHNRCRVLLTHPEIKYTIKEKEFKDKSDALLWVCYNQIGRRNLDPKHYEMLVGTAYNMAKKSHGGERGAVLDENGKFTKIHSSGENHHLSERTENSTKNGDKTRDKIARDFGTTPNKVRSASEVASAVMEAEEIQPGFRKAYESGEIKATKQEIKKIPTVAEEKKPEAVRAIMENDAKKKEKLGISKPAEPKAEKEETVFENANVQIDSTVIREQPGANAQVQEQKIESMQETATFEHSASGLQQAIENAYENANKVIDDILVDYEDILNTMEGKQAALNAVSTCTEFLNDYQNRIQEDYSGRDVPPDEEEDYSDDEPIDDVYEPEDDNGGFFGNFFNNNDAGGFGGNNF